MSPACKIDFLSRPAFNSASPSALAGPAGTVTDRDRHATRNPVLPAASGRPASAPKGRPASRPTSARNRV